MTPITTGFKSSEFWVGLVSVVLIYLNQALKLNIPVNEIVAVLGMIISYIFSRTYLKQKQMTLANTTSTVNTQTTSAVTPTDTTVNAGTPAA